MCGACGDFVRDIGRSQTDYGSSNCKRGGSAGYRMWSVPSVDGGICNKESGNVRAVNAFDTGAVADAIADCEVVCTAVGATALPHIAPNLAAGLTLRYERGRGPLNVLICENLHDAASRLRQLVGEHLPPGQRDA